MMNTCIFCEIAAGHAPASIVYQNERVIAFMDIQPVNPGHILLIPRQHAANLAELDPQDAEALLPAAQRVAGALYRSGLRCEGVNVFIADGAAAGQEVFHVHVHVFPRWERDGFGLRFAAEYWNKPARSELEIVAERIRAAI